MKRFGLWSCGCLLSVTLFAGVAGAQPAGTSASEISAIARSHYENGSRYYGIQRFAEAAREFQEAYDITHRTELLFNIGRAHEDAAMSEVSDAQRPEHLRRALNAYENFLASGAPGVDRASLQARMAQIRARLAAQPTAPVEPMIPSAPMVPPPVVVEAPHRSYVLPITLFAVGAVAFGGAVVTGLSTQSIHDDLAMRCVHNACEPSLESDANRGRTFATITDVLLAVGAASAVAGVVTMFVPSRRASAPTAAVWCAPGGCAGTIAVRF